MPKKLPRRTCVQCGKEYIDRGRYPQSVGWCSDMCWKYSENKAPPAVCCDTPIQQNQGGCMVCLMCGWSAC